MSNGFHSPRRSAEAPDGVYWFYIDVDIKEIFRRQRILSAPRYDQPVTISEYCVLHGIGSATRAITADDGAASMDPFTVDIAAAANSEPSPLRTQGGSATIAWSEADAERPEISIPHTTLRHLVELYVTKRIDRVSMFLQVIVGAASFREDGLPLPAARGRLASRQTHCELLAVHTALTDGRAAAAA